PEPTSVAALSDLFPHHNHLYSKEYNYTKPMQPTTDKRTSTGSLSYLTNSLNNNNPSNTSESRRIQRQSLNGNHNLNKPQSQHRLSTEIHTATTLNIAESENSNTGVCNISKF